MEWATPLERAVMPGLAALGMLEGLALPEPTAVLVGQG
jgi:hypothetical protein